jgi:hypothetical protein
MITGPSVILQEPVHAELCDPDPDDTDVEPSVPDRTEGAEKPPQISTHSRQRPSITELIARPVTRKEVPGPAQSKSGIAQRRRNMRAHFGHEHREAIEGGHFLDMIGNR